MTYRRYFTVLILAVTAFAAITLALTVLIDPYGLFRLMQIEGVNTIKPSIYRHGLWAKAVALERSNAKTVILGNSRFDVGLDPDQGPWPPEWLPAYNLAVPGQGILNHTALVRHILARQPQTRLIIGLEFLDFLSNDAISTGDAAARIAQTDPLYRGMNTYLQVVASLDSLGNALATLAAQNDPYAPGMSGSGWNPLRQYDRHVAQEGHFALAHQRNAENFRIYLNKPKSVLPDPDQTTIEFAALRDIVSHAGQHGAPLILVIYPYHADILEGFHHAGLWPVFEHWKRQLVALIEEEDGKGGVLLWDFSGYNAFSTERFPPPGDRKTKLKYYWETGHFKAALGVEMIRRLSARSSDGDFGQLLTEVTREQALNDIREQRRIYLRQLPEEARRVADYFAVSTAARVNP